MTIRMSEDDTFSSPRMKSALDELMKSEEGRELAENLRNKLKELNNQFKGLSDDEKKSFVEKFRDRFSDSLGELKDTISMKMGEKVDGEFRIQGDGEAEAAVSSNYNFLPVLGAVLVLVVIFG